MVVQRQHHSVYHDRQINEATKMDRIGNSVAESEKFISIRSILHHVIIDYLVCFLSYYRDFVRLSEPQFEVGTKLHQYLLLQIL